MVIISDIAGQYDALMRLVSRFPDEKFILVGDLVDRGPKSREVVQWAIDNQDRVTTLMGNHEHMMLDHYLKTGRYEERLWLRHNGGNKTRSSYKGQRPSSAHLNFLISRPLCVMLDGCLVTHAPLDPLFEPRELMEAQAFGCGFSMEMIWNILEPSPRPYYQIFGHQGDWGLRTFKDSEGKPYATCIDQSYKDVLTAIHWPTFEVFEEPYLKGTESVVEGFPVKEVLA